MLTMALRGFFAGGLFFCLLWPLPARAEQSGQFCWAFGSHDRSVYFAAIEGREDRSASFRDLLYISGIDVTDCRCVQQSVNVHRSFRES